MSLSPPSAETLLLVGAGGHGRVVADAAQLMQAWAGVQASDRNPDRCAGELLPGVVLLDLQAAAALPASVHISIGDNAARAREALLWDIARLVSVVHPRAVVARSARLGPGCFIAAGAVIGPMAEAGAGVIVNHGAVLDHDVRVGDFSHVAPLASLGGGACIGRRVLVGAGATVLPGMRVADDVVIGAGAVVNHPLTEPGTYAGAPARRVI